MLSCLGKMLSFVRIDAAVRSDEQQMFANDSGGAAAVTAAAGGMGFIGFTRVFMGTLRIGDSIRVHVM